jgi:hypothetical protein
LAGAPEGNRDFEIKRKWPSVKPQDKGVKFKGMTRAICRSFNVNKALSILPKSFGPRLFRTFYRWIQLMVRFRSNKKNKAKQLPRLYEARGSPKLIKRYRALHGLGRTQTKSI